MDTTESLKDHETGVFDKIIQTIGKEKVVEEDKLAFVELLAGAVKIEVDVQVLDEFRYGIPVGIRLLNTAFKPDLQAAQTIHKSNIKQKDYAVTKLNLRFTTFCPLPGRPWAATSLSAKRNLRQSAHFG